MDQTAKQIIQQLELSPHPEGGWYKETFKDQAEISGRSVGTSIYYLLEEGDRSHWHKVDASEIWHYYAGAPLLLSVSIDSLEVHSHRLGNNLFQNERPQYVVPKDAWQSAQSSGAWTLVGCTVSPGFDFAGFKLAPSDWQPGSKI